MTSKTETDKKNQIPYTKLQTIVDDCAPPQFVYWELNKHQYILVSIDIDDGIKSGIYFYDINNDTFDFMTNYPKDFAPQSHGMAIDPQNHDLYLFCGNSRVFGIYNIKNKKWNIKNNAKYAIPMIEYPLSKFVSLPYNELYVLSSGIGSFFVSKYCKQTDKFLELTDFVDTDLSTINNIEFDRCHFNSFQERIYAIDVNRYIWYLNVCTKKEHQKWKLYPQKVQKREWLINTTIVFDTIFVVVFHTGEIHCLDLLSNKWFKLEKTFPVFHEKMDQQLVDFVQTSDHYMHCFGFSCPDYDGFHVRISLHDLVPSELVEFYGLLMEGYVRSVIERKYNLIVPNGIIRFVQKYCCIP